MNFVKVVRLYKKKLIFLFLYNKQNFEIENWFWKLKIHQFEVAGVMTIWKLQQFPSSPFIHLFVKIEIIFYPQVRNYMTQLTSILIIGYIFHSILPCIEDLIVVHKFLLQVWVRITLLSIWYFLFLQFQKLSQECVRILVCRL